MEKWTAQNHFGPICSGRQLQNIRCEISLPAQLGTHNSRLQNIKQILNRPFFRSFSVILASKVRMKQIYLQLFSPNFILHAFLVLLFSSPLLANDTLHVRVHDKVDMVWFESYDQDGVFPSADKEFHRVWMIATLGCASGGCSDWDYTVNFHLLENRGFDSTIASIDTLPGGELDTIWSVDPVREEFEIGRLITPYGGYMATGSLGFNNDWTHRYRYDVTDFSHMLRDTKTIRAFYSGWSAGFSITLDFYFIEGTPPREVVEVKNIIHGSHNYDDAETYNEVRTPPVDLVTPEGTTQAKIRYLVSGHGFDNNVVCAEFCPREYYLRVDGQLVGNGLIWKDDCGLNPLFPQGGTWVYDRANWCPGELVPLREYELDAIGNPGETLTFSLDLEEYTWSGNQAPSYITSYQVVYYGDWNIRRDAELLEIMAPSTHEDHLRMNPICSNPMVRLRNSGADDIESITFEYGFPDGHSCIYLWEGMLAYSEEGVVELPQPLWSEMDEDKAEFFVRILEVNGQADEVEYNNELRSTVEAPIMLPEEFVINFTTNSRSDDFTYGIYREDGTAIFERVPGSPNTLHSDTILLPTGCYSFRVWDDQGLGLTDWPTGQGNSSIVLRRAIGNFWTNIRSIRTDFGTESSFNFTVGYTFPNEPSRGDCGEPITNTVETSFTNGEIELFPNPATSSTLIKSSYWNPIQKVSVFGVNGELIQSNKAGSAEEFRLDTSPLNPGVYFLKIMTGRQTAVKKLMIVD